MPEVTTCPDCEKKLKVPDNLIGKKVRCPGCGVMFTAKADGAEDETQDEQPKARAGARSDSISARKREAGDDDRPRARARAEEDDEDEKPRARRRDRDEGDDEDEGGRGRGIRRRDDEEDRPSRRDRDRDDEDDRRRSRRDDYEDDEDYPRRGGGDEAKGWSGTKIGVFLVIIANWLHLTGLGIGAIGAGTMLLLGGAMLNSFTGGGGLSDGGAAGAGATAILGIIFFGLFGVLLIVGALMQVVGQGICMMVPSKRGGALKGLAIAAFACACAALLINVGGSVVGGYSGRNYGGGLSSLLNAASFICWLLFLRGAAIETRDPDLGSRFLICLISFVVFYFVAVLGIVIAVCAGVAAAGNAATGGSGAASGAMVVVMIILGGLVVLGYLGLMIWYVLLMQRLRADIARHLSRL